MRLAAPIQKKIKYVSCVTCHMSHVTYHLSLIITSMDPPDGTDSPTMHRRLVCEDIFHLLFLQKNHKIMKKKSRIRETLNLSGCAEISTNTKIIFTALFYNALYCILYCTALNCNIMHCTTLHCIALHYTAPSISVSP